MARGHDDEELGFVFVPKPGLRLTPQEQARIRESVRGILRGESGMERPKLRIVTADQDPGEVVTK